MSCTRPPRRRSFFDAALDRFASQEVREQGGIVTVPSGTHDLNQPTATHCQHGYHTDWICPACASDVEPAPDSDPDAGS